MKSILIVDKEDIGRGFSLDRRIRDADFILIDYGFNKDEYKIFKHRDDEAGGHIAKDKIHELV